MQSSSGTVFFFLILPGTQVHQRDSMDPPVQEIYSSVQFPTLVPRKLLADQNLQGQLDYISAQRNTSGALSVKIGSLRLLAGTWPNMS